MKKLYAIYIATMAIFISAFTPVYAALPAAAETAFTTGVTDFGTMEGYAWTLLVPVTLAFIYMKWFRKGANRAS